MKTKIPTVLALYNLKLLTNEEVIEWADKQLMDDTEPFDFISELSLRGPGKCMKMPEYDFPRAREFSYLEEFSFRLVKLAENYDLQVDNFVQWVSRAAMGLDFDQREVHLGYLVDHYFLECDDMAFANDYLNNEIVDLLPSCKECVISIWREIA
jgi:hypothetical protein